MDTNILNGEIPVFKERRIYGINEDGKESSHYINSSYAGILRLSPNDTSILNNESNSGITSTDEIKEYLSYEDGTMDLLGKQFLRVSTSDGILLDMRISADAVEYNNLYVLGTAEVSSLKLYTSSDNTFSLNGINLPTKPNLEAEINIDNITDKNEETFILINNNSKKSNFVFKRAKSYIENIIERAFAQLSGLPTGSIHWVPLTLEQYKSFFTDKDENRHNHDEADPIIRDFLLCDGRKYKSSDFPELAKILHKEKITYWAPHAGDTDKDKKMIKNEFINQGTKSKDKDEDEIFFRVPDMRTMFLQYAVPGVENAYKKGNLVGEYEIDASKNQKAFIDKKLDCHYHYIVLNNSIKNNHNTPDWKRIESDTTKKSKKCTISFLPAAEETDETPEEIKFVLGGKPLAKYGSMRKGLPGLMYYVNTTAGCDTRNCSYAGIAVGDANNLRCPSYIYHPEYAINWACNVVSSTCGYILTTSPDYLKNKNKSFVLSDYIGTSSWNISMDNNAVENSSDLNYTDNESDTIYKTPKKYVDYDASMLEMLGYENTPEFYACLPLIKI